jgi:hypothetical protein
MTLLLFHQHFTLSNINICITRHGINKKQNITTATPNVKASINVRKPKITVI